MTIEPQTRLPRSRRIMRSSDFGRVYAKGQCVRGKYLVAWFLPEGEHKFVRLGVVASKRSLRKAHERNRAKRLLREVFRKNRDCFESAGDCVLIARHLIRDVHEADVAKDLKKALDRMR